MKSLILTCVVLFSMSSANASQGAASYGCDKEYTKVKLDFQKAYDSGNYEKAYSDLEDFLIACDWIKDKRIYWIYSDLSIAAFKMKNRTKCLDNIEAAEKFQKNYGPENYSDKRTAESMTPPAAALKALQHNKKLCLDLPKEQSKSK